MLSRMLRISPSHHIIGIGDIESGLVSRFLAESDATDSLAVNTGTFTSPVYAVGKYGQAFSFTGSNYVTIAHNASLVSQAGSWAFWMKSSIIPASNSVIIGKTADASSRDGLNIIVRPTTGYILVQIKQGLTIIINTEIPVPMCNGQWHHFAFCWEAGVGWVAYVDGAPKSGGGITTMPVNLYALRLARSVDAYWAYYKGLMDDVRIYNRKLTDDDVYGLYNMVG